MLYESHVMSRVCRPDYHRLYTMPGGIRTKLLSGRRIPLYHLAYNSRYGAYGMQHTYHSDILSKGKSSGKVRPVLFHPCAKQKLNYLIDSLLLLIPNPKPTFILIYLNVAICVAMIS